MKFKFFINANKNANQEVGGSDLTPQRDKGGFFILFMYNCEGWFVNFGFEIVPCELCLFLGTTQCSCEYVFKVVKLCDNNCGSSVA